jgi:hypothetical protein
MVGAGAWERGQEPLFYEVRILVLERGSKVPGQEWTHA